MKKYLTMFLLAMLMSVSVVSAQTYVTCQNRRGTGKGYYDANCEGNYLKCHGYYDSSAENYTVINYVGVNGNDYTYNDAFYAGKRNAYVSKNMGKPFNQIAHTHCFTVDLD